MGIYFFFLRCFEWTVFAICVFISITPKPPKILHRHGDSGWPMASSSCSLFLGLICFLAVNLFRLDAVFSICFCIYSYRIAVCFGSIFPRSEDRTHASKCVLSKQMCKYVRMHPTPAYDAIAKYSSSTKCKQHKTTIQFSQQQKKKKLRNSDKVQG